MAYGPLEERVGNVVRITEVVRVLVHHGFAHLVRASGLADGLPARVLRELKLLSAPSGEPETIGVRLRRVLCELGPTFVKFGQVLSTRPDVLGPEICDELRGLQDDVPAVPFDQIEPVLERELGGKVDELFTAFTRTPLAAASISQVYRARLEGDTEVVVKVRRPGIRDLIESDLRLMRGLAEWTQRGEDLDWTDPVAMVDEFARSIRRELDLGIERRLIERFRENFAESPGVHIPRTYPARSSDGILTLEYIDGVRVDAVDRYPERDSDPEVVARLGCEVVCKQVFEHRLFHADPHPGNVFLTRGNRIAFLDYGMVGRLSRNDVVAMADLLFAVGQADADACVKQLLAFTVTSDVDDRRALVHEVADYLAFEAEDIIAGGRVGRAIEVLIDILRRHRLELAPRFSILMKALATIESTARALDPGIDLLPTLRPWVERILRERYSPREIVGDVGQDVQGMFQLLRELPDDLQDLLRTLRRGRFHAHVELERLGLVVEVVDRASNRIAFGLVSGALIIGSSLLMTTEKAAPNLGFAGFLIAGLLGLGLLLSILRSREY